MVNYWHRINQRRISRRRALAATSTAALGAAFLAACGGDDGDDRGQDTTGPLARLEDTSSKAVPGGFWKTSEVADANGFNVVTLPTIPAGRATDFYTFLLKYSPGTEGRRGAVVGDSAESYEIAPDGLTLTMKIRDNHRFDPRPPTNARNMTARDVKFSWDRFIASSPQARDFQSDNPDSPIASLSAIDDKTIQAKLNFPYRSILEIFAYEQYLMIMPVEADGGFDVRSETRGAGPYYLDKWNPSVSLIWKKNPNWYEKGLPYIDTIEEFAIPVAATATSQFESGALWDMPPGVQQEDVLRLKNDHPTMVMYPVYPTLGGDSCWSISQQPDSPLRDERARQALSMLTDRDLYLEVVNATDKFTSAGIPVESRWNSHISSPNPEWLDPKKNELGENSKYFQHNPAEAKKLISAAGYTGQELLMQQADRHQARPFEILHGMWNEGFNLTARIVPYEPDWRSLQLSAGKNYNGILYNSGTGFNAEQHIVRWYTPDGRYRASSEEIPVLTPLARRIRSELDGDRQASLIKEFQREAAKIMPVIMSIGATTRFDLKWPWLENLGVWINGRHSTHVKSYYWYNRSKDPNAPS
jgi:peptide/nickel transport system substrate-binding protein